MEMDKTILYTDVKGQTAGTVVTIFDGNNKPQEYSLDRYNSKFVYFGRGERNNIKLSSRIVSADHGRFRYDGRSWVIEDLEAYSNRSSTNGLIFNDYSIVSHVISDGDFIRIDDAENRMKEGVLFMFSSAEAGDKWQNVSLPGKRGLSIGRDQNCDIVLPHVSVSKLHAELVNRQGRWYIVDRGSTNGITVNNRRVVGEKKLEEKDVIVITNSKLIFTRDMIYYCCYKSGIAVDASDIVVRRGKGKKSFITSDHVSLNIKPGELVAIIGGSGAGKSTILNCLCGYLKPTQGEVFINGVSLYRNFDSLKKLIGYVPQSDIVYDNLTLYDMLKYTAKLRLPKDTTRAEYETAINNAIEMVGLEEKRKSLIKSLSGGQKKRASIAVELLSDPNLLFLDEPASGLDPGTEESLMKVLRKMADNGKTVILVTHSTLQLAQCDKIAFMGKGGKLCFFGAYDDALEFFRTKNIVDVYGKITDNAQKWSSEFAKSGSVYRERTQASDVSDKVPKNRFRQLCILSGRYLKLIANDRKRLLMLLLQVPLLVFLISFVANDQQFEQYDITKSLLFTLSCMTFWVGMFNAIQEICKERTVLKREFMTGLSLSAYVASKILVLGGLCLIQSAMFAGFFGALIGLPEEGVITYPFLELMITTFFTAVAAAAISLLVSSLFNNADKVMITIPILLLPQIVFSGMIFKLSGAAEIISWAAICRWSMEGYGSTANLNALPLKLQQQGIAIPHEAESVYEFTAAHLLTSWGWMVLYTVIFLVLARIVLSKIKKEQ